MSKVQRKATKATGKAGPTQCAPEEDDVYALLRSIERGPEDRDPPSSTDAQGRGVRKTAPSGSRGAGRRSDAPKKDRGHSDPPTPRAASSLSPDLTVSSSLDARHRPSGPVKQEGAASASGGGMDELVSDIHEHRLATVRIAKALVGAAHAAGMGLLQAREQIGEEGFPSWARETLGMEPQIVGALLDFGRDPQVMGADLSPVTAVGLVPVVRLLSLLCDRFTATAGEPSTATPAAPRSSTRTDPSPVHGAHHHDSAAPTVPRRRKPRRDNDQ